jgi:CheY-like chemotaxis protein
MLTIEENPIVSMARKNLPVCVLDDEADLVDLTTDRLTKLGFPTVGTIDPQAALQKIRLGGCGAVIADFKMPAMDGQAASVKTSSTGSIQSRFACPACRRERKTFPS